MSEQSLGLISSSFLGCDGTEQSRIECTAKTGGMSNLILTKLSM